MTIEPPQVLSGQTHPMDQAKVVTSSGSGSQDMFTRPIDIHHPTSFGTRLQGDTPDQYLANDPGTYGTSPSSMLMYEPEMSDIQKTLLSPASSHSSMPFGEHLLGGVAEAVSPKGEAIDESRLNLEDMDYTFDGLKRGVQSQGIKCERPWSPEITDTGQATKEFQYENVMMNKCTSQKGPTLAELNNTSTFDDISMLDDINSIISNDLRGHPSLSTLKLEPSSPPMKNDVHMTSQPPAPQMKPSRNTSQMTSTDHNITDYSTTNTSAVSTSVAHVPVATVPTSQIFMSANINCPQTQQPAMAVIKTEGIASQQPVILAQMPIFQTAPSYILLENKPIKPKLQKDWSYPGELSTLDKPSLLKLLSSDSNEKLDTVEMTNMTRRPIHVPKRTRGLSEGSGLLQLQLREESETRGLKRSGSPDSDNSNVSLGKKWEEIKKYLDDASPMKQEITTQPKRVKTESISEPIEEVEEKVPDYGSDSDSDLDFSDTESIGSHSSFVEELLVGGKKEKRFFWQYNTQAKGPKGKRLCKNLEIPDPHVLNTFEDPVFDPDMNDAQYRHTGRARKGDGNDITPSPWKLFQIGNQLKRLQRKIHDIAPPGELPSTVRSDSRREKNKYASRACRLKKKAQHEANKIKLYGLDTEHAELMTVLVRTKRRILENAASDQPMAGVGTSYSATLDANIKENLTVMIAGNTVDYVNSVLEKVAQGDKTGGLDLRRH